MKDLSSTLIAQRRNVIVLLRHAHREETPAGYFGNEIQLSQKGKEAAKQLGNHFVDRTIKEIHTSPLDRCLQTAEEFNHGASQSIPIRATKWLGDPGPFVKDPQLAGSSFLQKPLQELMLELIQGQAIPGVRSLEEGSLVFLEYLRQLHQFPCLLITHDIILCLLSCFFFKSQEIQKFMPGFLEGLILTIDLEEVTVYFEDQVSYYQLLKI